jgi:ketosteroid isomerase-like protein
MAESKRPHQPESEVRELVEGWLGAIRRHDLDAVVAHHDPAVVFFDVPEPVQTKGIEAYKRSWQEFLAWVTAFDDEELTVTAGADVAYCHAVIRCAGRTERDPFPVRLTIGCRRLDGRWVIAHEHHSVPSPPTEA